MSSTKQYSDRATSAGYRFPVSRISSAYHKKCVPAEKERPSGSHSAPPAPTKTYSDVDYQKCDAVTGDRIWRESVGREHAGVQKWEEGWGFLKDYDQKGNLKKKEDRPDNLTRFSAKVPNTANQALGHRQSTGAAKAMVQLQHQLSIGHQKKHNKELVYGAD
ncbi:ciliary microtubule inner protein 5-like isoform X1 [Asterias amurensis]|uniref:ciliary microtubule inner protein 5-like isoform X1 n=1 Tax=Asterias amurensis TaxID=7602 RepID=UPI003AB8F2EC